MFSACFVYRVYTSSSSPFQSIRATCTRFSQFAFQPCRGSLTPIQLIVFDTKFEPRVKLHLVQSKQSTRRFAHPSAQIICVRLVTQWLVISPYGVTPAPGSIGRSVKRCQAVTKVGLLKSHRRGCTWMFPCRRPRPDHRNTRRFHPLAAETRVHLRRLSSQAPRSNGKRKHNMQQQIYQGHRCDSVRPLSK